mmetsp:Transcript_47551/g.96772  ORF Transcript_47551/g.96772 Transcript_47551/m.96772 type:complete len:97 (+) Transcript_47551:109-399(+)
MDRRAFLDTDCKDGDGLASKVSLELTMSSAAVTSMFTCSAPSAKDVLLLCEDCGSLCLVGIFSDDEILLVSDLSGPPCAEPLRDDTDVTDAMEADF